MDKVEQILALIKPSVQQGKILHRSRQQITDNIDDFVCLTQAGIVIACAGLKDCQEKNIGEIYALAVSKNMQNQGFSTQLLDSIMQKARHAHFSKIFALSKFNSQWFLKQGFSQMNIAELPLKRQATFDYQRCPFIFFKDVD